MEYSGHGKSSGKFTQGNITKWTNEVKISIKKVVKSLKKASKAHASQAKSLSKVIRPKGKKR